MQQGKWIAALGLVLAACGSDTPEDSGGTNGTSTPKQPAASGPAWFEDVAGERGLDFRHESGFDGNYYFPEIMGGGAALFDMDSDGDLDAYLVQSGSLVTEPTERSPNQLYENDGTGRFADVTEGSGADDRGYGMGVATGDANGDGLVDLYVTNVGPNAMLFNEGGGRFRDVTRAAGVGESLWSVSTSFFDADNDGDLDLFVANYLYWSVADELYCSGPPHGRSYCSPVNFNAPAPDTLYRNDGDGTFSDVSSEAGIRTAFGNGLGVIASDVNSDGWMDVFVANDGMENQLWVNLGEGKFEDRAAQTGCAVDQNGQTKAGMGVTMADVDDDGDEDLLVVNLTGESDSFYRNEGTYFSDKSPIMGLSHRSRVFTRFGVGFIDFDNDGWLDIYEANGRVTHAPEYEGDDPFAEPNLLFRGTPKGRFEEVKPQGGVAQMTIETSRAAAFGDVDGDGAVDVLVVNRDLSAYLLRNVSPDRGGWISLAVFEENGRPALGARVHAKLGDRNLMRVVRSGFSYTAANDPRVHVGLGDAQALEDVRVRWVDGTEESFGDLGAGQVHALRRGQGGD